MRGNLARGCLNAFANALTLSGENRAVISGLLASIQSKLIALLPATQAAEALALALIAGDPRQKQLQIDRLAELLKSWAAMGHGCVGMRRD